MLSTLVLLLGVALALPAAGGLNGQGTAGGAVDLAGAWSGDTMMSRGKDKFTLVLERAGATYAGTMSDAMGLMQRAPIGDVQYSDGTLRFAAVASLPNRNLQLQFTLRLENGRLVGTWAAESGDTGSLELERAGGAAAGAAGAAAPAEAPAAANVRAAFAGTIKQAEALVASEFAKDGLGSVTVGLVSGPRLVWAKSFGLADIEGRVPATPDTIYRIGSMTKPFTALMLLQLVERGKVHLSEPVETYFPEIKAVQGRQPWYPAPTFIQLATHTSGIDREPAGPPDRYVVGPVSGWENVLVSALPAVKYVSEPDTRFLYANVGYAILGAALGRVAKQPYVDYLREQILVPLGMTHTAFELDAAMRPRLAKGYEVDGGKADPASAARELEAGRGHKVPNGGLFTTVGDLARFVSFQLGEGPETVLSRATRADNLTRTNSSVLDLSTGYGIGFIVSRRNDLVIYGHAGDVAGYSAVAQFDRASRTGVIVLSNASGGQLRVGPLADRLLELMVAGTK
jgi:CubicO group peptidase (beta-lactamase class C family)